MNSPNIKRYKEREFALQILYACEFNSDPWREQMDRLEENSQIQITNYINELIATYQDNKNDFDQEIIKKLKNWEFSRVAVIDRVILRMAIAEILFFQDIPPEVSINEAIELAKKYSTAQSGKFINGLLDAIFKQLSKEKRIGKHSN